MQMNGLCRHLYLFLRLPAYPLLADIPSMPIDAVMDDPNEDEDLIDPNDRRPTRLLDSRRQADGELSDSDDEGEGGRRNHARYRDRDSTETHKFGIGGGILSAGSAPTHGAGPSSHNTAVRILTKASAESMDIDDEVNMVITPVGARTSVGRLSDNLPIKGDSKAVNGNASPRVLKAVAHSPSPSPLPSPHPVDTAPVLSPASGGETEVIVKNPENMAIDSPAQPT